MERILLFVLAVVAGMCLFAGVTTLPTDARAAGLYFLGALFAVALLWRSSSRLRAAMRRDRADS